MKRCKVVLEYEKGIEDEKTELFYNRNDCYFNSWNFFDSRNEAGNECDKRRDKSRFYIKWKL